jgi:hypothetical protein
MSSALSRAVRRCIVIGGAIVIGAGFGVALIGATEIATAITAQRWVARAKDYADFAPLIGGAIGAVAGWIRSRSSA